MLNIRKIREEDRTFLEKICLDTANEGFKKNEKSIENTLLLFNRYYLRQEKENSFVLVNENDEAVGYILCAENFTKYRTSFLKNEYREICKLGLLYRLMALSEIYLYLPFHKKYPAHLHIDILPEYQGGGNGTRLITQLLEHLKQNSVKGVMLVTGADNIGAIRFYERNGFKKQINFFGAYVMKKQL